MHKHYNYLQGVLKQKVFTKVIKLPSGRLWVQRPSGSVKMGEEALVLLVVKRGKREISRKSKYPRLI
jgi:hypothetical protein